MFEGPTNQENISISEQEVIAALEKMGIEDEATKELLGKFVNQCQAEADKEAKEHPGDKVANHRAHIKADIKVARVYFNTVRYEDHGREMLEDLIPVTSEDPELFDLAEEIDALLDF